MNALTPIDHPALAAPAPAEPALDAPAPPVEDADPRNPWHPTTAEAHNLFTPALQAEFLKSLQIFGNVATACRHVKVARQTAYRARRRLPGFARAWNAALVAARIYAEDELADRAIHGIEEKVFYHGEEVGSRRRYSDRLLLAHIGRLDRLATQPGMAASLAVLDDDIEALERGEELAEEVPVGAGAAASSESASVLRQACPEPGRRAQDERGSGSSKSRDERGSGMAGQQETGFQNDPLDTVTCVTPCARCRKPIDPDAFHEDDGYDPYEDPATAFCAVCDLDDRVHVMNCQRPLDTPFWPEEEGATPEAVDAITRVQLEAFERGWNQWYCAHVWQENAERLLRAGYRYEADDDDDDEDEDGDGDGDEDGDEDGEGDGFEDDDLVDAEGDCGPAWCADDEGIDKGEAEAGEGDPQPAPSAAMGDARARILTCVALRGRGEALAGSDGPEPDQSRSSSSSTLP